MRFVSEWIISYPSFLTTSYLSFEFMNGSRGFVAYACCYAV